MKNGRTGKRPFEYARLVVLLAIVIGMASGCGGRRRVHPVERGQLTIERETLFANLDPDLFVERVNHLEKLLKRPDLDDATRKLIEVHLFSYKEYLELYTAHVLDNREELRSKIEQLHFNTLKQLKEYVPPLQTGTPIPPQTAKDVNALPPTEFDVTAIGSMYREEKYQGVIDSIERIPNFSEMLDLGMTREIYAVSLAKTGRIKDALVYLQEVLQEKKSNGYSAPIRLQLAECYALDGKQDTSIRIYRKLVQDYLKERPFVLEASNRIAKLTGDILPLDPEEDRKRGTVAVVADQAATSSKAAPPVSTVTSSIEPGQVEELYLSAVAIYERSKNSDQDQILIDAHTKLSALLETDIREKVERLLVKIETDLAVKFRNKAAEYVKEAKKAREKTKQLEKYEAAYKLLSEILGKYPRNPIKQKIETNRTYIEKKMREIDPHHFKSLSDDHRTNE